MRLMVSFGFVFFRVQMTKMAPADSTPSAAAAPMLIPTTSVTIPELPPAEIAASTSSPGDDGATFSGPPGGDSPGDDGV